MTHPTGTCPDCRWADGSLAYSGLRCGLTTYAVDRDESCADFENRLDKQEEGTNHE